MVKPVYLTITTFLEGYFLWLNKKNKKFIAIQEGQGT